MAVYDVAHAFFRDLKKTFDISKFGVGLDVAVTPDGTVFLTAPSKSGLWRLQADPGNFVHIRLKGVWNDYYFSPAAIAADYQNRLWIANPYQHEILICTTDGQVLSTMGQKQLMDWPVSLAPLV